MKPEEYIKQVLERCEKATPGPWLWEGRYLKPVFPYYDYEFNDYEPTKRTEILDIDSKGPTISTKEFIAHSRTDVEKLARYCLSLREVLKSVVSDGPGINNGSRGGKTIPCSLSYSRAKEALEKEIE